MRTWPALHVGRLTTPTAADAGAGFSRPEIADLFQAALLDYDVAAIDDNMPDAWRVFFTTADERDRAHQGIAADFPELAFTTVDVPDEDWAARSQAALRAIRVGNIVVAPPWDVAVSRSAGALALASPLREDSVPFSKQPKPPFRANFFAKSPIPSWYRQCTAVACCFPGGPTLGHS